MVLETVKYLMAYPRRDFRNKALAMTAQKLLCHFFHSALLRPVTFYTDTGLRECAGIRTHPSRIGLLPFFRGTIPIAM
jgi:hypothetical protein